MSITTTSLTRAAGISAVVAGLLFIGVQVNHPVLTLDFVTTTEFAVRQSMKVGFSVLALAGISGMYRTQVRKSGVLGLVGYLIAAAGFLTMFAIEVAALVVVPAIVRTAPSYVSDFIAVAMGGHAAGDLGLLTTLNSVGGVLYMAGGLVFGVALFRANVLARWACVLLAVATPLALVIPLFGSLSPRLFAVPTGLALIALGSSLWRQQGARVAAAPADSLPESAVAR